ncbi:VWA domain-containing protein [Flaviaesturariibacter amylovorans]|uniref:VWFA domain-containing protein n=1 Tax=Flaviaesturariibacter amylovorans TaxID=1084520 RepID=A0ABP8G7D0_9BACT
MKQKTHYHLILDRSGSMQDCRSSTISGFNEQLQTIRSLQARFPEQAITVGLTVFNESVQHQHFGKDPHSMAALTSEGYQPGGSTALYDAIGSSIALINRQLEADLINGAATVVVVVMTDGYENASRRYTAEGIRSSIRELEGTGKWTFSYLGATEDAVEVATDLNFRRSNSMAFVKSEMRDTFNELGRSMDRYLLRKRRGESLGNFLEPDGK